MTHRQPFIAAALAIAVTWAGVVCACALPVAEAPDADGHHAHHAMEESPHAGCAHADCDGDCAVDATPPKIAPAEGSKTSLDDGFGMAVELGQATIAIRVSSYHHPPWKPARPVDSPVRRFDKLLN